MATQLPSPPQVSPDGQWAWNGTQWVPNTQPPPVAAPHQPPPYETARGRSSLASIFLGSTIAGIGLLAVADVAIDMEPGNPSDSIVIVIGLLSVFALAVFIATYVLSIVFFCRWLHRVIRNMPALGSADPRWSPGGAVLRCFIPFLNLLHPLWSVIDAWRGSDPSRRYLSVQDRRALGMPALTPLWWGLWLGGGFLSRISANMTGPSAAILDVVSAVALAAAAILLIRIVRDLTTRQDSKWELIGSGRLA